MCPEKNIPENYACHNRKLIILWQPPVLIKTSASDISGFYRKILKLSLVMFVNPESSQGIIKDRKRIFKTV